MLYEYYAIYIGYRLLDFVAIPDNPEVLEMRIKEKCYGIWIALVNW